MRKLMLLGLILIMPATVLAQAWDWEMFGIEGEIHGSVDLTYQSKYVWRGFDVYADKSAVQLSVDLDLFQTGWGVGASGHRANSSGYENFERWDYSLYYQGSYFDDQPYVTKYRLAWVYYNYPDLRREAFDLQEIHAVLSWPAIIPVKGLVPTYVLVKLWPADGASTVGGNASGFAHIFMLDYMLNVPGFLPEIPEQVFNIHSEIVFNDGVSPVGTNVDHDWSNAVIGVTTNFDLGQGITMIPGVYYQYTMERRPYAVNVDEDETWATVSMKYAF